MILGILLVAIVAGFIIAPIAVLIMLGIGAPAYICYMAILKSTGK